VKGASKPDVTVGMSETGYSLVTIWCREPPAPALRPASAPLTDMHYVVNHGTIDTERTLAFQVCCAAPTSTLPLLLPAPVGVFPDCCLLLLVPVFQLCLHAH